MSMHDVKNAPQDIKRYPFIPNPADFHTLVERLRANEELIAQHNGDTSYGWPKSLDLGYMAVHYSGGIAWSRNSPTGGMSVATTPAVAQEYMRDAFSRIWAETDYHYGLRPKHGAPPRSKVLAFVRPNTPDDIVLPTHGGNEGMARERIVTSVHLTDFDSATQQLIREIFGEAQNPQYIEQ